MPPFEKDTRKDKKLLREHPKINQLIKKLKKEKP